jgi:AcrR family transcriptional regulator
MARDKESPTPRRPLSKDRVLRAAVALADRDGLGSLTMRRLGRELGVEAMSLYKHVANKDEILDGIIELVVGEIEIPEPGSDWKTAMRIRAASARQVLRRHPWAIGLFESRGAFGPAIMRYLDAIIASLRAGGFSAETTGHAFSLLDSYVYGHVIQEISFETSKELGQATQPILEHLQGEQYPHLAELVTLQNETSAFDYDTEFEFGLDLILGALDIIRTEA